MAWQTLPAPVAQARAVLGLGIVQDFSLAPMLALIPVIAGQRGGGFGIAESLLISAVVLIAAFLLGTRLVPPLLRLVARSGSRKLFLKTDDLVSARRHTVYGIKESEAALKRGRESDIGEAT